LYLYHADTSGINEVSSRSPADDELGNNVEHFSNKEGKTHPFGGPSELASGLTLREINRQVGSMLYGDLKYEIFPINTHSLNFPSE
jgi:hypothetical protein